ncbi:hypothetical protein [Pleomorphovibrio marinus]|uniref:hypothetical protein n=1 Tax=Pleomorphovibrio marinus TaxID=2164132 RepID=UPI000E0BB7AF|nr:hypothetical protein [Pleomorphovibrio marinus]
MKIKEIRLWVFIFGLLSLIAVYLFFQSKSNREQLENQSLKAISLSKKSFLEAFQNYHDQLEGYFIRNFVRLVEGEDSPAGQFVEILDSEERFDVLELSQVSKEELKQFHHGPKLVDIKHGKQIFIEIDGLRVDFSPYRGDGLTPRLSSLLLALSESNLSREYGFLSENQTEIFESKHLIPLEDLMEHNQQSQFFDEIYILDSLGSVVFPASYAGLKLLETDDLENGLQVNPDLSYTNKGDQHLQMQIGTVDYEGFLTPMRLAGTPLFLLGVKESSQFQRVAYRIDFNLLSLLLIALSLVFVAIPLISIFTLSEGDVLTKKRVVGLGFSLIVFMLVLGFTIAFFQNQKTGRHPFLKVNEQDGDIKKIEKAFVDEVVDLLQKLEREDVEVFLMDREFPENLYEYLSFSTERGSVGDVRTFIFPDRHQKPLKIDFGSRSVVAIPNRDYVKAVAKDTTHKAFISAQFSKASGKLEGVISSSNNAKGKAITFAIDRLAPEQSIKHRYFIFKPEGKVLLKSDKVNIPVSNLQDALGDSRWKEIKSLVENNPFPRSEDYWEVPVHVNGYGYVAILKKLDISGFDSPIWGLYLVDQHLQNTLHAFTALEALFIIFSYFLMLFMLTLFNRLATPKNTYLRAKPFDYAWYRPRIRHRNAFLFSNYLLFFLILLFASAYLFLSLNFFMSLLWALIFGYHASICNYILIHGVGAGRVESKEFNFLGPAITLLLIFMSLQLFFLLGSDKPLTITFSLLLLILLLGIMILCGYWVFSGRLPDLLPDFSKSTSLTKRIHFRLNKVWNFVTQLPVEKRIFALNFLLWIFILGFIPGYILHRHVFHQENYIWEEAMGLSDSDSRAEEEVSDFYQELINIHEKVRRNYFTKITHRDEQIHDFVSANVGAIKRSFFEGRIPLDISSKAPSRSFLGLVVDKFGRIPLLVALVLITLLIVFHLLLKLSNRVFLIDYLFSFDRNLQPESRRHLGQYFVVCLDSKLGKEWFLDQFKLSLQDVLLVDLSLDQFDRVNEEDKRKSVLILNFHWVKDRKTLKRAIEFLKEYLNATDRQIFIHSGKPILDVLNQMDMEGRVWLSELTKTFLFFTVPLHFRTTGMPQSDIFDYFRNTYSQPRLLKGKESVALMQLNTEISYGHKENTLALLTKAELENEDGTVFISREKYEKAILTIQRYNKTYFFNIWDALNFKERKMVYYYAAEGFINYTNRETLSQLLQKGVMVLSATREKLVLFTESFRNFVLLNVTQEDLKRFNREESEKGNAKTIKGAIISFVFIAFALLSYFDPGLIDQSIAYVSGAVGVLGTIYSVFQRLPDKFWRKNES